MSDTKPQSSKGGGDGGDGGGGGWTTIPNKKGLHKHSPAKAPPAVPSPSPSSSSSSSSSSAAAASSKPSPAKIPSLQTKTSKKLAELYATHPTVDNLKAILSLPDAATIIQGVFDRLPPYAVEARALARLHCPHYIKLTDLMHSINNYEEVRKKDKETELEPALIDVWAEYDTFVLSPIQPDEKNIGCLFYGNRPYRPTNPEPIEHSIPDKKKFEHRFNVFTEYQFVGWLHWNNMIVIGGSLVAALTRVPDAFIDGDDKLRDWYHNKMNKRSDIDVYIYGLNAEQFAKKIFELYLFLKDKNPKIMAVRTPNTITFASEWPNRHIQIVIGNWKSVEDILFEVDIDCTAVAYDGKKLWTTQRGRFSYNHKCLVATPVKCHTRGIQEYVARLIKYSRRGYYIWDEKFDMKNISFRYLDYGKQRLGKITMPDAAGVFGLRLLICGVKFHDQLKNHPFFQDTERLWKDTGLPYGPRWTCGRTRAKLGGTIMEPSNYGPFAVPNPITAIVARDYRSMFDPVKERLKAGKSFSYGTNGEMFHKYIFLEDDKTEVKQRIKNWRCGICYKQIPNDTAKIGKCKCLVCEPCLKQMLQQNEHQPPETATRCARCRIECGKWETIFRPKDFVVLDKEYYTVPYV